MSHPHPYSNLLGEIVAVAVRAADAPIVAEEISRPDPRFGDLAIPCFRLAKSAQLTPPAYAIKLAEKLSVWAKQNPDEIIATATAAGPYCNLRLNRNLVAERVTVAMNEAGSNYGYGDSYSDQHLLIEYISPNTNKPLHVGHLRNASIGWSVGELVKTQGGQLTRAQIVNDRGVHIMQSLIAYERWGNGETPESTGMKGDHLVAKYYVLFNQKATTDARLKDEAQEYLKRWEDGDETVRALWRQLNDWAEAGHKETEERIGLITDRKDFESEIYEDGKAIVRHEAEHGPVERNADGALVIDLSREGLDKKVLLRADGTSVYVTQDIALVKKRLDEIDPPPDKIIYVVAHEQDYHFKVLFEVLELFGLAKKSQLVHLGYNWVTLPQGRMKSREGTVVDTDNLLDEIEALADSELASRFPELNQNDRTVRSQAIALAAIKYYLLKVRPNSDVKFNPEESISFQGRTGPYLLYTYARLGSILRKAGDKVTATSEIMPDVEEGEWPLYFVLTRYPRVVRRAALEMDPSLITDYSYELARAINDFYESTPVLKAIEEGDKKSTARLVLVRNAKQVLGSAMGLLGISPLETM